MNFFALKTSIRVIQKRCVTVAYTWNIDRCSYMLKLFVAQELDLSLIHISYDMNHH